MIGEIIEATGMGAYICLAATFLLGMARWKLHWSRPRLVYHYILGIAGMVFATAHVILIVIYS